MRAMNPEQPNDSEPLRASEENTPIRLDQFLKLVGVAATGGHAKLLIQSEQVLVNGEIETRRRKQLAMTDEVSIEGQTFTVNEFVT